MTLCPLGKTLHPTCLRENVPVLTVNRSGLIRLLNINELFCMQERFLRCLQINYLIVKVYALNRVNLVLIDLAKSCTYFV